MALKTLKEFCEDNHYGMTPVKMRYLLKTDPSIEKTLRRISARNIFIDEELFEDWIASKKYFNVTRKRAPK